MGNLSGEVAREVFRGGGSRGDGEREVEAGEEEAAGAHCAA